MQLRDHPLLSYKGQPSWPPVWTWVGGSDNRDRPKGEVGILRAVQMSRIQPADRCFLYIEHRGAGYLGCLLTKDHAFCGQIAKLLEAYCGLPIRDIGDLDLSHTL